MYNWEDFHSRLNQFDILGSPLDERENRIVKDVWLERFFGHLKVEANGKVFRKPGYYCETRLDHLPGYLDYDEAWYEFLTKRIARFLVYWESADLFFECLSSPSPDMRAIGDEIHIFPHDFSWNLMLTHETAYDDSIYYIEPGEQRR